MKRMLAAGLVLLAVQLQAGTERVRHRDRFRESDAVQTLGPAALGSLPGRDCRERPAGEPQCKLTELATLGGSRWYWLREDDRVDGVPTSVGRLLEVGSDSSVAAVWGVAAEGAHVWDGVLLRKPEGVFLHVPVRYPGTGALRDDLLFRWTGSFWQEVDTLSWVRSIRLPPCYGLWKGPFLDFETLSLEMDVWIDGDGNCCPSGGSLRVRFSIRDDVLAVEEWRHVRSEGDGSPWDPERGIDTARCGPRPQ